MVPGMTPTGEKWGQGDLFPSVFQTPLLAVHTSKPLLQVTSLWSPAQPLLSSTTVKILPDTEVFPTPRPTNSKGHLVYHWNPLRWHWSNLPDISPVLLGHTASSFLPFCLDYCSWTLKTRSSIIKAFPKCHVLHETFPAPFYLTTRSILNLPSGVLHSPISYLSTNLIGLNTYITV